MLLPHISVSLHTSSLPKSNKKMSSGEDKKKKKSNSCLIHLSKSRDSQALMFDDASRALVLQARDHAV